MITQSGFDVSNKSPFLDYRGLSTDTKPTDAPNGSTFFEIDTGNAYMFNAAIGTWTEI